MGADELDPGRALPALQGEIEPVALEDDSHRLVAHLDSQVGHCPDNPAIAPRPVLSGQAEDEFLDLGRLSRASGVSALARAVELAGDELAVPAEDDIGGDQIGDLGEGLATEALADPGESLALRVGEPEAAFEAFAKNLVLRDEVLVPEEQFLVDRPRDVGEDSGSSG